MRNGMNGIGVVRSIASLDKAAKAGLIAMDAVCVLDDASSNERLCPTMIFGESDFGFLKRDVVLVIWGSNDNETRDRIAEAGAGRIVFVGKPGPNTKKALKAIDSAKDAKRAVIIDAPEGAVRLLWTSFDDMTIASGDDYEKTSLVFASEASQKPSKPSKRVSTRKAKQNAPETQSDASEAT